jgi:hypothetical protein
MKRSRGAGLAAKRTEFAWGADFVSYLESASPPKAEVSAQILAAGWSKGSDARDSAGRIVPLYTGSNRATIIPAAVAFSPYGAMARSARPPELLIRTVNEDAGPNIGRLV